MFKVICIDQGNRHAHLACEHDPTLPEPEIGEICEVIETKIYKRVLFYRIAGYGTTGYECENFALLDGPDERERLEAYTKEQQQLTEADRLLQAYADSMPTVQMEPGAFERVWANVSATL